MTQREIQVCLDNMVIIADTREHQNDLFVKRCYRLKELTGNKVKVATVNAGDYSAITWDADGKEIDLRGVAVIERKKDLDEIATNLTKDKDRFEREFTRAKDAGVHVYLLIEKASMKKLLNGTLPNHPFINKNSVIGSFFAMLARYRLQPIFCNSEDTADVIYHIMCKELEQYINPKDAHRFDECKPRKKVKNE